MLMYRLAVYCSYQKPSPRPALVVPHGSLSRVYQKLREIPRGIASFRLINGKKYLQVEIASAQVRKELSIPQNY